MIPAMPKLIPFIALIKEVYFIFDIHISNSEVFCKSFEENQSCISVTKYNKLSPRPKNVGIKYHRFRKFVLKKIIWICYIDTQ